MKTNKYSIMRWFVIAICALPLMSAECDNKDDDISGGGGGSSIVHVLSDYLRVENASAHYIGANVVIDLEVENKSGRDISDLLLNGQTMLTDNNGKTSYGVLVSAGEGQKWLWPDLRNFSLNKGESRKVRMRVDEEDVAATVTSLKLNLRGESQQLGITNTQEIPFSVNVADRRKSSNAIWTNDDKMSYSHPTCRKDGEKLYATFAITNKTGIDLRNVEVYDNGLDNGNGSSYGIHFGIDDNYGWMSKTFNINNGETIWLTIMVENFFNQTPRCLNAKIKMSADNYTFACDHLYLTTISLN